MTRLNSYIAMMQAVRRWLETAAHGLDLAIRFYVADVFIKSGLTKIDEWDKTVFLFQEEYHVPLLPPELAAALGTFGELFFPPLLALGIATRFSAFSLFIVNIVAVVSYWHVLGGNEAALMSHYYWGTLLLVTLLHGPGKLALDSFIWPKVYRKPA